MRYDRTFGAFGGESPIPYQAISQYARDHGFSLDELEEFRVFMTILDGVYIEMQAAEAKRQTASERLVTTTA